MSIVNFSDFCKELLQSGVSMGGGNAKGIYAIIPYGWVEQDQIDSPVKWHTGDAETDPWEWRMRVLEERDDIAYGKFFFRSSGYITKEWFPAFYAVRRGGESAEEAYQNGTLSQMAKRVYDLVDGQGALPVHEIKRLGGFTKEDGAKFDRAVTELQMRLFLTLCGRQQKRNRYGEGYGWSSTVLATVEHFWQERGFSLPDLHPEAAMDAITTQIHRLNPTADPKKIARFIKG